MSKREPITYADAQPALPPSDFAKRLAELRIARTFEAANTNDRSTSQRPPTHTAEKSMVEQDQPRPAPRPTLPFADDVDAASFNDRWAASNRRQVHV